MAQSANGHTLPGADGLLDAQPRRSPSTSNQLLESVATQHNIEVARNSESDVYLSFVPDVETGNSDRGAEERPFNARCV